MSAEQTAFGGTPEGEEIRKATRRWLKEGKPPPVWYGLCGHWTADWGKLKGPGIPSCPLDNAVGFHAEPTWWADVDAYEAAGHPGYRKQVEALEIP